MKTLYLIYVNNKNITSEACTSIYVDHTCFGMLIAQYILNGIMALTMTLRHSNVSQSITNHRKYAVDDHPSMPFACAVAT